MFLLVEDHELEYCRVPELPDVIRAAGIDLVRFPVRDPRIPDGPGCLRGGGRRPRSPAFARAAS